MDPKYFASLERAKKWLLHWTAKSRIPLVNVEYVVPFVLDDYSLSCWCFYKTDAQVAAAERNGTSERLRVRLLRYLRESGYPCDLSPRIAFVFDSKENVDSNYEGSYFYRLR